jgi:hypothetical protein
VPDTETAVLGLAVADDGADEPQPAKAAVTINGTESATAMRRIRKTSLSGS